jgi:cell division protein FtsI/penicillin-binding protein 2
LANDGELLQPTLIAAVQDSNGRWISQEPLASGRRIFDESVANNILASLPVEDGILEYSSLVPSGSEGIYNAWYIGLAPSINPQYGVVVVLENKEDLDTVESIGRSLLSEIT